MTDPATIRLGPRDLPPTQAEVDAGVEAFLTRWSAGSVDDEGRSGLARDVAAALGAAYQVRASSSAATHETQRRPQS